MIEENINKKILCTLGPSSLNPVVIRTLDKIGVDIFRLNLSHTKVDDIKPLVELIRENSDVPICLDTQGAQLRTGSLFEGTKELAYGESVELVPAGSDMGDEGIPIYPGQNVSNFIVGDYLSVDFDGAMLEVVCSDRRCEAVVIRSGMVGSNKAISLINRTIDLPALTNSDLTAIDIGMDIGIRHVALSFANKSSDVDKLREITGPEVSIISKIESRSGLDQLDSILSSTDAILIDRGDLSREVRLETIPAVQKEIIRRANNVAVPVYVATNLLESMVMSPKPTRAEVNDVMNTLLDGADGLVLAAETAIGKHPIQCVNMIDTLIRQFDAQTDIEGMDVISTPSVSLISPHGGRLVDRVISQTNDQRIDNLPRLTIDDLQMCDVRQIAMGGFSPLEGFMNRDTLESVLEYNKLDDGTFWPMPVLLQTKTAYKNSFDQGQDIALVHRETIKAVLHIEEVFQCDLDDLAQKFFGTMDQDHQGVARLKLGSSTFLSGKIDMLESVLNERNTHELTPADSRLVFEHMGWRRIAGLHAKNIPNRAHEYIIKESLSSYHCDGILVHSDFGNDSSINHESDLTIKAYRYLSREYLPADTIIASKSPNYVRHTSIEREILFNAVCQKNYGCNMFLVGNESPISETSGSEIDKDTLVSISNDVGIDMIVFDEIYYCEQCNIHTNQCLHTGNSRKKLRSRDVLDTMNSGQYPPDWQIRKDVADLALKTFSS